MTNDGQTRLDRIEALVQSNAKAIEALTEDLKSYQREAQLDRTRLYQTMADLSRIQASHYEKLEAQDEQLRLLSQRQGEIVDILKILAN